LWVGGDGLTGNGVENGPLAGDFHHVNIYGGGQLIHSVRAPIGTEYPDAGWNLPASAPSGGAVQISEYYGSSGHTAFTNGLHLDYSYVRYL
jgi:hypothetical protein